MSDYDPPRLTRQGARQAAGWSAWAIAAMAALIVAVIVLGSMAIFGFGFFQRATADFRGKTGVINKRADANYRIANYESFYDLCAAIRTKETAIAALTAQLAQAEKGSLDYTITSGQLTGTKTSRADDINQYNADARKQDTKGRFQASDLPYQLDETQETTTCSA